MPTSKTASSSPEPAINEWLTRGAFGLSLALVLARGTMLEVLRDPLEITPGAALIPRGPGPATALVLDLLAWIPALLVLTRSVIDRTFSIRFTWVHAIFALLALWTILSTAWAADKFAALVSGFHWLSAGVFLWSTSQLVRSWKRLRIVAGVCLALLLLFGTQALSYRYVERAEMRKDWEQNREQHLRERGLDPETFAARAFEAKLLRGEMVGFAASSNTFAAVTVLLMVVTLGLAIQRIVDRDGMAWILLPGLGILVGGCIILWADSKTAFATPLLAGALLAAMAVARDWLGRNARLVYALGIVLFVIGVGAVIGHGTYHGSLVIDSMTFRWRYWVGAAHVFAAHPLLGVGWDNFGLHYLAARLPIAAEEIRDPHNFFVRAFAELGLVGGVLTIGWILRLWWELTQRKVALVESHFPRRAMLPISGVVIAALVLSVFAGVDLAVLSTGGPSESAYVTLRLVERCVAAIMVFVGLWIASVRSLSEPTFDIRPAPWIFYATLAGLAVFLLHNLVDFSMFEVGPMFLFALLTGSALGIRQSGERDEAAASLKRRGGILGGVTLLWVIAGFGLAVPVLLAEEQASAGDEFVRTGAFAKAADAYQKASSTVPYNGDYAMSAARIMIGAPTPDAARSLLDRAIRINPANAAYHATRAEFEARLPNPDIARLRSEFEIALNLDPANVPLRLQAAERLAALGFPVEAAQQYEKALWFNDQLQVDEVERLSLTKVAEIQAIVRRLKS